MIEYRHGDRVRLTREMFTIPKGTEGFVVGKPVGNFVFVKFYGYEGCITVHSTLIYHIPFIAKSLALIL